MDVKAEKKDMSGKTGEIQVRYIIDSTVLQQC